MEDDQHQSKGKALATFQYNRDLRSGGFQQRPKRKARAPDPEIHIGGVNVAFKELVHKILEQIKKRTLFSVVG